VSSSKDASTPVYTVKFNRDVSKCSYTASPAGSAGDAPGVQPTNNFPDSVTVTETAAGAFHLQVIC
jgi:hypothetical protein